MMNFKNQWTSCIRSWECLMVQLHTKFLQKVFKCPKWLGEVSHAWEDQSDLDERESEVSRLNRVINQTFDFVFITLSLYRYVCDMVLICMLFIYLTMHIVCILFTLLLINFTLLILKLILCIELYLFKPNYIISVTVVHFIISLHILLFISILKIKIMWRIRLRTFILFFTQ